MNSVRIDWTILIPVLVLALTACGGCGSSDPESDLKAAVLRANDTNGKRLATLYVRHNGRFFSGPRDEAAFKKFIAGRPALELEELGVSSGEVDAIFVSERDKHPFYIRYGLTVPDGASRALVLETQGLSNKAQVVFVGRGGVRELSVPVAELEDYRTGKKDEESDQPPTSAP